MDEKRKSTFLDRSTILSKTRLATATVRVPEWGGSVRVRELTGEERDRYEAKLVKMQTGGEHELTMDNARASLVAASCIDEAGEHVFTTDDVEGLGKLSGAALSRVFDVVAKMSRLTDEDLKELTKN